MKLVILALNLVFAVVVFSNDTSDQNQRNAEEMKQNAMNSFLRHMLNYLETTGQDLEQITAGINEIRELFYDYFYLFNSRDEADKKRILEELTKEMKTSLPNLETFSNNFYSAIIWINLVLNHLNDGQEKTKLIQIVNHLNQSKISIELIKQSIIDEFNATKMLVDKAFPLEMPAPIFERVLKNKMDKIIENLENIDNDFYGTQFTLALELMRQLI